MKSLAIALLPGLWFCNLNAQETPTQSDAGIFGPTTEDVSTTAVVEKDPSVTAPPLIIGRLSGEPVLTPPPPPRPLPPRLIIPEENTLTSKIYQAGDHMVTIEEVSPVELPPRPTPAPALTTDQRKALLANRPPIPKRQIITLCSTIYDHRATHLTWRSDDGKRVFEGWSNVDFELLRGVSHILHDQTQKFYFHLGMGTVDTAKMTKRYARFNRIYQKPAIPDLPADPEMDPTFIVTKGSPGPDDLEKIQVLHDLYKNEHARLRAAAEHARLQKELRAAELAANPPKAPDIVVKRWSLTNQKVIPNLTIQSSGSALETKTSQETATEGGVQ